jgi:hypothetical protein
MNTFITYEGLPISSGGAHSISSTPPDIIYNKTLQFLNTFTDSSLPTSLILTIEKPSIAKILKYSNILGLPKIDIDSFIGAGQKLMHWTIPIHKIDQVFELLPFDEKITVSILCKFKFVDIASKALIKGQDAIPIIDERLSNSQIYVRISKSKSTISTWLAFPFDSLTGDNLSYIDDMKKTLPFKFSDKHWRLWTLSKKGNWTPKVIQPNGG